MEKSISSFVFVVFGSCRYWGRLFVVSSCQKGGIFLGFPDYCWGFLLLQFWRVELAVFEWERSYLFQKLFSMPTNVSNFFSFCFI